MKLKKVERKLCRMAKTCEAISCAHIKPHKAIIKGDDRCKYFFCAEVNLFVDCEYYVFEREVVETLTKGDSL